MCAARGCDELPRLDAVIAVITGCGDMEEDQRRFATAWRRIELGDQGSSGRSRLVTVACRPISGTAPGPSHTAVR
jgi:hypothetical protein